MSNQAAVWIGVVRAAVLSVVACVLVPRAMGAEAAGDRPNFLLITSEDMSPDLGCYGDAHAVTPNLDGLARLGNRYSAAYANAPICSPARSALLTGMYQTRLGAGNHRSAANPPAGLVGFAAVLREAGYYCTNHPKVDYNVVGAWDVERATYDRGQDWRDARRDGRPFLSIINIEVSHQSYTSVLPHEAYERRVRAKLPVADLRDPADVVVPPYFPDTPAVRRELARYADCVSLMDRRAGEILDRLREDGLADDTIVMYFSDHGAGHPRHKSTPFASGLRVPLIVYCPPKFEHLLRAAPGSVVDDVVEFIDVGPTLLHLAGIEVPAAMDGEPFMGAGAVRGELAFGALDRRAESINLSRTVTDGRHVYVRSYMPHIPIGQPKGYGFPSAIYKELWRLHRAGGLPAGAAAYMAPPPAEMLFDLVEDPFEVRNVAGEARYADVLARLRAAHEEQIRRVRDLNFVPEEELAARAGDRPWVDLAGELPLEDIYGAAALVGRGLRVAPRQAALLAHPDSVVRWWAVVGLRNQDMSMTTIRSALERSLRDDSELVRTEAAAAVLAVDPGHEAAREVLIAAIGSARRAAAHRAARAAQLLRMHDDGVISAVGAAAGGHGTEWLGEVLAALRRQRAGLE